MTQNQFHSSELLSCSVNCMRNPPSFGCKRRICAHSMAAPRRTRLSLNEQGILADSIPGAQRAQAQQARQEPTKSPQQVLQAPHCQMPTDSPTLNPLFPNSCTRHPWFGGGQDGPREDLGLHLPSFSQMSGDVTRYPGHLLGFLRRSRGRPHLSANDRTNRSTAQTGLHLTAAVRASARRSKGQRSHW